MSKLKISVITVSYNSAATIKRTVQSVLDQDYVNIEYIIIDGFSSDGTLDVLSEFENKISVIISEPDNGIYDAMNKGLTYVTGDVVCFLNSDDFYSNNSVISQVANIMRDCNLDALYGDVCYFSKNKPQKIVRWYHSNHFKPERLAWGWMPAHQALFLSRQVVDRVGKFNINYKIAADYDYIIRSFYDQNLRYLHLPEVLVYMQMGGVSTRGLSSAILLNKEVLRACLDNGINTNIFKIISKYPLKLLGKFR